MSGREKNAIISLDGGGAMVFSLLDLVLVSL
jgi:hypothetical protein